MRPTHHRFAALLALVASACTTEPRPAAAPEIDDGPRPTTWAQPIERRGLPNLARIDAQLYRGAQPTAEGWKELEAPGVRAVLSLRAFHGDHPPEGSAMRFERISFKTWHPEDEDVVRFLRFASDPANQPLFVHCAHGADRTGLMCAIWRVVHDGWSREDAIREMLGGQFGFHLWNGQLVHYVREADLERFAREAGMEPAGRRLTPAS